MGLFRAPDLASNAGPLRRVRGGGLEKRRWRGLRRSDARCSPWTQQRYLPARAAFSSPPTWAKLHRSAYHLIRYPFPVTSLLLPPKFGKSRYQVPDPRFHFVSSAYFSSLCPWHRVGLSLGLPRSGPVAPFRPHGAILPISVTFLFPSQNDGSLFPISTMTARATIMCRELI